jgi:hypothetical protein
MIGTGRSCLGWRDVAEVSDTVREEKSLDVVLRFLRRRERLPAAAAPLLLVERQNTLQGSL